MDCLENSRLGGGLTPGLLEVLVLTLIKHNGHLSILSLKRFLPLMNISVKYSARI
jgi:hypothetical protein